jgi:hypothetical protein
VIYWSKDVNENKQINQFNSPVNLLFDQQNNLYVLDTLNDKLKE